jgi:hypothetical protein
VPLARYSRDEIAVVSGGTGICISSLAPSLRVQPSGVVTVAGSPDGTSPSTGSAASGGAGSESGSAPAEGAMVAEMTTQTATTAARRSTTAIGITADTVSTVGFK